MSDTEAKVKVKPEIILVAVVLVFLGYFLILPTISLLFLGGSLLGDAGRTLTATVVAPFDSSVSAEIWDSPGAATDGHYMFVLIKWSEQGEAKEKRCIVLRARASMVNAQWRGTDLLIKYPEGRERYHRIESVNARGKSGQPLIVKVILEPQPWKTP